MERDDSRAHGFLLRSPSGTGIRFFRLFEDVPSDRGDGEVCRVARWTSEPMTARRFETFEEADKVRDEWGLGLRETFGIVPAHDPFGRASYRRYKGGVRVE